jgi:hypothetical protein
LVEAIGGLGDILIIMIGFRKQRHLPICRKNIKRIRVLFLIRCYKKTKELFNLSLT